MDPEGSVVRLTVWSAMPLSCSRAASSKQVARRTFTHFHVNMVLKIPYTYCKIGQETSGDQGLRYCAKFTFCDRARIAT